MSPPPPPPPPAPGGARHALHLFDAEDPFVLGVARSAHWEHNSTALVFGLLTCAESVPVGPMAGLVASAAAEMQRQGAADVAGMAGLGGLCSFILETRAWVELDEPAGGTAARP